MSVEQQNNKEMNDSLELDFSLCHGDYYEYCYCRI